MEYTIAAEGGLLRARVWGREAQQPPTYVCDAMLAEANDMIDIVAGNRGLNVKNFRDVESALAWLQ